MLQLLQGLQLARKIDPRFQFAWENVGYGALRHDKRLRKALGEGVVVRACAYGRKSGKTYRLWLSSETAEEFSPILPTAKESMCRHCKEGRTGPHEQGYCPPKGSKQKRISEEGRQWQQQGRGFHGGCRHTWQRRCARRGTRCTSGCRSKHEATTGGGASVAA